MAQGFNMLDRLPCLSSVTFGQPDEIGHVFDQEQRLRRGHWREVDEDHDVIDRAPRAHRPLPLVATLEIPDPGAGQRQAVGG